jgi:hypothetical protein
MPFSLKPVIVDESCVKQMTWERSIREQAARVEKDKKHGHELPFVCGDEVMTPEGRVGVLVHKEFLYRNTECGPGHDVWMLDVKFKAYIKTYSNPAALTKHKDRNVPYVLTKTE